MARGRKPMPPALVDKEVYKKSNNELAAREEWWDKMKTSKVLEVPNHLSSEAKKEWERVMKLYSQMEADILSDLDQQALIMYCEATAIYKKAQEQWAKLQQVATTNPDGQKLINSIIRTMERQTKLISSLSEQLCLTPVGRARIGVAKKQEPTKFEKFLMGDE